MTLRNVVVMVLVPLGTGLTVGAVSARAEVREVYPLDASDPVALDVRQARATFDRTAGTLNIRVVLHSPAPGPAAAPRDASMSLWFTARLRLERLGEEGST